MRSIEIKGYVQNGKKINYWVTRRISAQINVLLFIENARNNLIIDITFEDRYDDNPYRSLNSR